MAIKRVENRQWSTTYRGPLAIHAGLSKDWLQLNCDGSDDVAFDERYGIPLDAMVFGAIIAKCNLVACLSISGIRQGKFDEKYPWVRVHDHTEGPYCFVLENIVKLERPIYTPGQQKFWIYEGKVP